MAQPPARAETANDGSACTVLQFAGTVLDDDTQMVIAVFPEIEVKTIEFEFTDVELP
jgi:hypothetical protein